MGEIRVELEKLDSFHVAGIKDGHANTVPPKLDAVLISRHAAQSTVALHTSKTGTVLR